MQRKKTTVPLPRMREKECSPDHRLKGGALGTIAKITVALNECGCCLERAVTAVCVAFQYSLREYIFFFYTLFPERLFQGSISSYILSPSFEGEDACVGIT